MPACPTWALGVVLFLAPLFAQAEAVDWKPVVATDITLFYPGQASLQWILDATRHPGAQPFRKAGVQCQACHQPAIGQLGGKILQNPALEPAPLSGRRATTRLEARATVRNGSLVLRLRWPAADKLPATRMRPTPESVVSVLLGDAAVKSAVRTNCWSACHADSAGMPAAGRDRTGKYLIDSRPGMGATGGGPAARPAAELASLLATGTFLELWQAGVDPATPGAPVSIRDGYILERVHYNAQAAISGSAQLADGHWTVELRRPLAPTGTRTKLLAGVSYNIGFALHDQHTAGRFHLVSLPYRFSIRDGKVVLEPLLGP